MIIIKKWYEEAILECPVHKTSKESFIIKRGIRIAKANEEEHYRIEDIRECEFFTELKSEDYKELVKRGFISGCDHIGFDRDIKEIARLKKLVEMLYGKKKKFERPSEMRKDRRLNLKRIRNLYKNIDIYIDQIFLYEAQITQFNNKYNKN
tara:strand:- start:305 stop:757 length:453 start_codon:yes stop_codon:yes gene_type:complete